VLVKKEFPLKIVPVLDGEIVWLSKIKPTQKGEISISEYGLAPGEEKLEVKVKNNSEKEIKGVLSLELPGGLKSEPAQSETVLATGEKQSYFFKISNTPENGPGRKKIAARLRTPGKDYPFGNMSIVMGQNLALLPQTKIEVDSTFNKDYSKKPLNDGVAEVANLPWSYSLSWASVDSVQNEDPHWIEIVLPGETDIHEVDIFWNSEAHGIFFSREFEVQVWQGKGWKTVVKTVNEKPVVFNQVILPSVYKTGRVRVYQPSKGGPASRPNIMWVSEVEVY